jgi:hypothetical protein
MQLNVPRRRRPVFTCRLGGGSSRLLRSLFFRGGVVQNAAGSNERARRKLCPPPAPAPSRAPDRVPSPRSRSSRRSRIINNNNMTLMTFSNKTKKTDVVAHDVGPSSELVEHALLHPPVGVIEELRRHHVGDGLLTPSGEGIIFIAPSSKKTSNSRQPSDIIIRLALLRQAGRRRHRRNMSLLWQEALHPPSYPIQPSHA